MREQPSTPRSLPIDPDLDDTRHNGAGARVGLDWP